MAKQSPHDPLVAKGPRQIFDAVLWCQALSIGEARKTQFRRIAFIPGSGKACLVDAVRHYHIRSSDVWQRVLKESLERRLVVFCSEFTQNVFADSADAAAIGYISYVMSLNRRHWHSRTREDIEALSRMLHDADPAEAEQFVKKHWKTS
jgi:hypothetical protein